MSIDDLMQRLAAFREYLGKRKPPMPLNDFYYIPVQEAIEADVEMFDKTFPEVEQMKIPVWVVEYNSTGEWHIFGWKQKPLILAEERYAKEEMEALIPDMPERKFRVRGATLEVSGD